MTPLIFHTNPISRGRIVRWMLEEAGCFYTPVIVPFDAPAPKRSWPPIRSARCQRSCMAAPL